MALSSSERTRYHKDHSSIPPTCFRGRKNAFIFVQMPQANEAAGLNYNLEMG